MKKIIGTITIVGILVFSSCSKPITCQCTMDDGYVTTFQVDEGKESKSIQSCEDQSYATSNSAQVCKKID